jgi:hypothetical protein
MVPKQETISLEDVINLEPQALALIEIFTCTASSFIAESLAATQTETRFGRSSLREQE